MSPKTLQLIVFRAANLKVADGSCTYLADLILSNVFACACKHVSASKHGSEDKVRNKQCCNVTAANAGGMKLSDQSCSAQTLNSGYDVCDMCIAETVAVLRGPKCFCIVQLPSKALQPGLYHCLQQFLQRLAVQFCTPHRSPLAPLVPLAAAYLLTLPSQSWLSTPPGPLMGR